MNDLDQLWDLVRRAKAAGADAAEAAIVSGTSVGVQRRLGKTEQLGRSEGRDLGFRVFIGQRSAGVSSTAVDPAGFDLLVERAMAMARVVPEDPYSGLCEAAAPPEDVDLDLVDAAAPDIDALLQRASAAEEAALAVAGVTNSEGASASYGRVEMVMVTSAGFAGSTARTTHSVSATALAGAGTGMERDYDSFKTVHLSDLEPPEKVGRVAGEKAVARLNPRRPKTAKLPVVFDPRVSGSLLSHLAGAINGGSIARGTSFLKERMGQQIFPRGISVHDDARRKRGLRSHRFDAEGVPTRPLVVIDDGVLKSWFLDGRTGRQLGLATTGHASASVGATPSPMPTNLYLQAGTQSPAALMADIKEGLYVTEMMGSSVNIMTGDYSRGAAGFMIRDGALAEPVSEITIAGSLLEMFMHLSVADDLVFRRAIDAPTVRLETLTMAGA